MIKAITSPNSTGNNLVTKLDIKVVNEIEKTILADCLDDDDNIISKDNWFIYAGTGKSVPFTLTKTEIKEINQPTQTV